MERCVGCWEEAPEQPLVAVMLESDAADQNYGPGKSDPVLAGPSPLFAVAVPLCRLCHEDPTRRLAIIKGHFFERGDMIPGVDMAFVTDEQGKAGLFG